MENTNSIINQLNLFEAAPDQAPPQSKNPLVIEQKREKSKGKSTTFTQKILAKSKKSTNLP